MELVQLIFLKVLPPLRLGVKYISKYLSTSTSTLKPLQVQVQVQHLNLTKYLSTSTSTLYST